MQNEKKCDKISTKDGWLLCPVCGRGKVAKVLPDTKVANLPVYCRLCRKETVVNIDSKSLSQ